MGKASLGSTSNILGININTPAPATSELADAQSANNINIINNNIDTIFLTNNKKSKNGMQPTQQNTNYNQLCFTSQHLL